jgi:hypothetical protein
VIQSFGANIKVYIFRAMPRRVLAEPSNDVENTPTMHRFTMLCMLAEALIASNLRNTQGV